MLAKNGHRHALVGLAVLLVTCVVLGGCEKKKKIPPPPPPKKADLTPEVMKLAEEKPPVHTYIYSPVGKRDPFRSHYKVIKGPKEQEKPGGILTKYDIDQLKLTAIITGISKPRAQVELPDGKGVIVKVGSRIGKNYGRVVRIKSDELVIAEDFRDSLGRKMTNYIRMRIEREEKKK